MEEVRQHLVQLTALMQVEEEAIAHRAENTLREAQHLTEAEIQIGDRVRGALNRHRKEHGC